MSDSESSDSDVQDFKDLDMIFELGRLEQQQEKEAERVRHRNYIYRERVEAEARLMADYFGPRPKYPDYYFRLRYRMSRKLVLDIVSALIVCTGNGEIAQKHGMGNLVEVIKSTNILLEAVDFIDLWIWHAFFGVAGANNDLTVLNNSLLFDDLLDGISSWLRLNVTGLHSKKGVI
ncbi:ALP1-like protein isoform X1 [Tanacetum coccineum]